MNARKKRMTGSLDSKISFHGGFENTSVNKSTDSSV